MDFQSDGTVQLLEGTGVDERAERIMAKEPSEGWEDDGLTSAD